ncbi:uncharacterized protein prr14 isoform 1-T1 [Menidia menidia]
MLTYPSDLLPQIYFPMDEDAIPSIPVCSAPVCTEPPPPLLPLSSITPSFASDGLSGHRKSGRNQGTRTQTPKKQDNADSQAVQRPSRQNPSLTKRQRENALMVQESKQPRVEIVHEETNEEGFGADFTAEQQNLFSCRQLDSKGLQKENNVSSEETVVDPEKTEENRDAAEVEMDLCGELVSEGVGGHAAAPTGWVIGPLFQSLKSKMASFTDIVMTPVKLFRANSPPLPTDHLEALVDCELQADETPQPHRQNENENQSVPTNQESLSSHEAEKRAARKYSKRLDFREPSTQRPEQALECAVNQMEQVLPDLVPSPLNPSPPLLSEQVSESFAPNVSSSRALGPSATVSASRESKVKKKFKNGSESKKFDSKPPTSEDQNSDQRPSQKNSVRSNNHLTDSNQTLSLSSVSCDGQPDAVGLQPLATNAEGFPVVEQSLGTNGPNPPQLKWHQSSDACPAAGLVRAKRGLKLNSDPQDSAKRTRTAAFSQLNETQSLVSLSAASEGEAPRAARRTAGPLNAGSDRKEKCKKDMLRKVSRKGKSTEETPGRGNEAVTITPNDSCPDPDLANSLPEDASKGGRAKPSGSLKALSSLHANTDNCMDLETTVAIRSAKQAEEKPFSEVLVRPEIKQLQSTTKVRNTSKKPLKRKSPNHTSPVTEWDSSVESTSSVRASEATPAGLSSSEHAHKGKTLTRGPGQSTKRPKNGLVRAVGSTETQGTKQGLNNCHFTTKESQLKSVRGKCSVDPVYFEMTPFELNPQPLPPPFPPGSDSPVWLGSEDQRTEEKEEKSASLTGETFLTDSEMSKRTSRSSTRPINARQRRADNTRRRSRVFHLRPQKAEEMPKSVSLEDADLAASQLSGERCSRRLLRSYSCPEIPTLLPADTPWAPSHPGRTHRHHHHPLHPLHHHLHHHHSAFESHAQRTARRARRHTVCSVEVEREIAPLCLRKEVYPSRRPAHFDPLAQHMAPTHTHSPSTYLSALASCFLSSPLAFLSKKVDGKAAPSGPGAPGNAGAPPLLLLADGPELVQSAPSGLRSRNGPQRHHGLQQQRGPLPAGGREQTAERGGGRRRGHQLLQPRV